MRRWPAPAVAVVLLLSLPGARSSSGAWTAAGNLQMLTRDQLDGSGLGGCHHAGAQRCS